MAPQTDYTAAANAILAVLKSWIAQDVPSAFQSAILPAMPALAGACAKAAVDAVAALKVRDN